MLVGEAPLLLDFIHVYMRPVPHSSRENPTDEVHVEGRGDQDSRTVELDSLDLVSPEDHPTRFFTSRNVT